jgi:hypothetical protein
MRDWIHLAQNIHQWAVTENTVMNILVPITFIKAKHESNSGSQKTSNIPKALTSARIMEAASYSESSVHLHQTARHQIPQDGNIESPL